MRIVQVWKGELDKVQLAVEEKYRDVRGQVLDFDDVLNDQRKIFYRRRQNALFSDPDGTLKLMEGYNKETVSDIVKGQTDEDGTVKVEKVLEKIGQFFPPVVSVVAMEDIAGLKQDGVTNFLNVAVEEMFKSKVSDLDQKAKVCRLYA